MKGEGGEDEWADAAEWKYARIATDSKNEAHLDSIADSVFVKIG